MNTDRLQGAEALPTQIFDYGSLLQEYGRAVLALPDDSTAVFQLLAKQLNAVLNPIQCRIFAKDRRHNRFTLHYPPEREPLAVEFNASGPLPDWLNQTRRPLVVADPPPADELDRSVLNDLQAMQIAVCAPLPGADGILGWVALGPRQNGQPYTADELVLLTILTNQTAIVLEKQRAVRQAEKRAAQLSTLIEVSQAISATLNLESTLEQVMQKAVEILNTEAGSLFLLDPRTHQLRFEVVLGPAGKELRGKTIPVGVGIVGTVAETGQPLIINDVAEDPRWNVSFDQETDFRTRDILCVPMVTRDTVVGVIELVNKKDGLRFTEDDRDLLLSFAAQSAIAIENAQRFTRTDRALAERVQELQALQMFDQDLQTSLELERVLNIFLTHALDALGISVGVAGVLIDQPSAGFEPGLYLLAQRGMPMEMGRYRRDPWPLNKGILGRVARTGEPAWVNDISQDKDYVPKNHRTRSMLVMPVLRENKVIAVIDLESIEPDYFTSDDVNFIRLLANHASLAIENAQLFQRVKEANQAKTEFMNTASHELKIPMTSIKGYARLLEMGAAGELTEQQKNFLGIITNNVDRMAKLVNDLLDVSRIEAGRIRLEISDVDIIDVIREVVDSLKNQIGQKKQQLSVNITDDLPEIRADRGRIVQVLTNLLSNAHKYTPEGGKITITASPHRNEFDGVAVTVTDTGYGISEEDQARLFTPFFRASDDNIREEPGTGLGLTITKKMVESHGGELTFTSTLGKGTSFTFTLPTVCKIPPGVEVIER